MNNRLFKFLVIIIVIFIFLYGFSSSYSSRNIDNISYAVGLGIDEAEDGKNLKVSFEFTDIYLSSQNGSSSEKPKPIVETVIASSVSSAINMLNVYLAKEVNLAHCKVIVFSEKIAKKGIFNYVSDLINNPQVRPTSNLIISKNTPEEYLKTSTSSLDKVLTKYYDIFPNSSKYTGYISNITIGYFYNSLLYPADGNLAILGGKNDNEDVDESEIKDIKAGQSPIFGERGTENIGLAVLNKDKYVGDLTATQSLYHSIITTEVNSFLLSIDYPGKSEKLDLSLSQDNPTKISISIVDNIPNINIDISLNGKVSSILKDVNYSDENVINNISNLTNEYLKKNILNYLNKTTSVFKCDIDNFSSHAKKNFLTADEWDNYNWSENYLKAKFNVNVETKVVSSLLVSGV